MASDTGTDSILAELALEEIESDTGAKIAQGKRIEFFEGRRKYADGVTRKTGHRYWHERWTDIDTGRRRSKYGGKIETCPDKIRVSQYRINSQSPGSLAERLFRTSVIGPASIDTGTGG